MDARLLLDELVSSTGTTYAEMSALIGRNRAYIQQFIKRGTPRKLTERDEAILARHFDMPPDFLRRIKSHSSQAKLELAAAYVRKAMRLCDEARVSTPQCHLQLGLDLMPIDRPSEH